MLQDGVEDHIGGHALSLALKAPDQPVSKGWLEDGANVLCGDGEAAARDGPNLGGAEDRLGAAGRGAEPHVTTGRLGGRIAIGVSGLNEPDDDLLDVPRRRDVTHQRAERQELVSGQGALHARLLSPGRAIEDRVQLLGARALDVELEQKAVELGLRQRVGPSISKGFWVARTKKGSGSSWVVPEIVTDRSAMASSMADWVRGVARFTSSARTTFVNKGPRWKSSTV